MTETRMEARVRAVMVTAYGGTDVLELVEIASPAPGPGSCSST